MFLHTSIVFFPENISNLICGRWILPIVCRADKSLLHTLSFNFPSSLRSTLIGLEYPRCHWRSQNRACCKLVIQMTISNPQLSPSHAFPPGSLWLGTWEHQEMVHQTSAKHEVNFTPLSYDNPEKSVLNSGLTISFFGHRLKIKSCFLVHRSTASRFSGQ